jgi:glutamate formiminotransferase
MAAEIARSVRESSGGLQSVQALSLYLHKTQKMQISMNLLDYGITNIPTVYTKVESIAADYGFEILESELVGMTPRVALGGVDPKSLKISNFSEDLVLENFVDI